MATIVAFFVYCLSSSELLRKTRSSRRLELQCCGKMLLFANIFMILQWRWDICHLHFSLYLQWLGSCHCFTHIKGSPFHKLLCSQARVSLYSSAFLCECFFTLQYCLI